MKSMLLSLLSLGLVACNSLPGSTNDPIPEGRLVMLRSAEIQGQSAIMVATTTGCTQDSDFVLHQARSQGMLTLSVYRIKEDRCRRSPAPYPLTFTLTGKNTNVVISNPVSEKLK